MDLLAPLRQGADHETLKRLIAAAAYGKLWFQAFMSDADVSFTSLVGMGFRQVNPRIIVQAKNKAGTRWMF